jgi:hypothetical protein
MSIETAAVRGVAVHYGPRSTTGKYGRAGNDTGLVKTAEWTFNYNDLPVASDDTLGVSLPAYAKIVAARLEVLTPFAGGTSYNIGLYTSAGVAIDADGIDAAVATAAIDARGDVVVCDGALVNGVLSIGDTAGKLTVAATGTYTAGKARLVVEYVVEKAGN